MFNTISVTLKFLTRKKNPIFQQKYVKNVIVKITKNLVLKNFSVKKVQC